MNFLARIFQSPFTFKHRILLGASMAVLANCGGGGGGGAPAAAITALCNNAIILNNQLEAGDVIQLKTTKQLTQIYLATEGQSLALDSSRTDMGYQFAVPITPELAREGGKVLFEADLDGTRCKLPEQTVLPLPAAANEDNYNDALDSLEEALLKFESMFAYAPDTVTSEDIQNDPILLSAHFVHEIFNNPISEISLPYQRDLFTKLSPSEKAYIAQIVEKLDLVNVLSDLKNDFDSALFTYTGETPQVAQFINREQSLTRAKCSGNYANTNKHRVDIRDGQALSIGMKLAYEAQEKLNNSQAKASASATKSTIINTLSTIGSQVKGGAFSGPLAIVGTISGMLSVRDGMADQMVASLLPSKIIKTDLQIIPKPKLEEDYTEKFTNPIWSFRVDAQSREYDFSKLVADTALIVLGVPTSPVDPNLMAGLAEVSNKVTSEAGATDCELIVPSISWFNIPIDTEHADAKFINGSAFQIDASNKRVLIPQEIGQSELELKLKSISFPSFSNTLADQRATQVMENLQKTFIFSSNPIVVQNPGETATVDITVLNSVSPEAHKLAHTSQLSVSKSIAGDIISLVIDTPSDAELFPQSVTLSSTSKSLKTKGDRAKQVEVKLNDLSITIEETLSGSCDGDLYTEENHANVKGFANDKSVVWTTTGGTLTVLPDNSVRFSTTQLGSYILTATSNEDSTVTATTNIKTLDCNGNIYMRAVVLTNAEEPNNDSFCQINNPEDVEKSTTFGTEVDDYDEINPSNIRNRMSSFSKGRPFTFDQSDSDTLTFSELVDDQCLTKRLDMVADSEGTIENLGDNTVGFGSRHDTQGYCYTAHDSDGDETVDCVQAGAVDSYEIVWVFEHKEAASYEIQNEIVCSAKPIEGFPSTGNLTYAIFVFNSNGEKVNVLAENEIPIFITRCVDGISPNNRSWNVPTLTEGANVMILGTFANTVYASPPVNGQIPDVGTYSNTGEVSGYIKIKVD